MKIKFSPIWCFYNLIILLCIGDVIVPVFKSVETLTGTSSLFDSGRRITKRPNLFAWLNPRNHIQFFLWTRLNPSQYEELNINDVSTILDSHFNASRDTKVIIHGFANYATEEIFMELYRALLTNADVNVISVEWKDLSIIPFYHTSMANTELVSEQSQTLLRILQKSHGLKLDSVHLIGFSLGAHIAGFIGYGMGAGNIGRITGMDPAGPGFNFVQSKLRDRLHWSQAQFVDIIHTSAAGSILLGAGLMDPIGHVDFYPNGGVIPQPGCAQPGLIGYISDIVCSHRRALELLTDSVKSNVPMKGCLCSNWNMYLKGSCNCNQEATMGMNVQSNNITRGTYFLRTNSQEPFGLI